MNIAEQIARDIFNCGYEYNSPTDRIEFKNDKDVGQGGLCESALARLISTSLNNHSGVLFNELYKAFEPIYSMSPEGRKYIEAMREVLK